MLPLRILFGAAWRYRAEILLAVQALAALRKSAEEAAREYIRRRIEKNLSRQIAIVAVETLLLVLAFFLDKTHPSVGTKLFASFVLWAITLYNLWHLVFSTIPELRAVYLILKGKVGFTMKYVLRITLVTELMELDVFFLVFCLVLALSSRSYVASTFHYFPNIKQITSRPKPRAGTRQYRSY